jgi:2'-5' RNA ligase
MWSTFYMKLSLVSYLDQTSSSLVREIQQNLSDITGSKASLSSWQPHVTVGDGVEVNEEQCNQLKNRINEISTSTAKYLLKLHGIGTLDNWKGGAGETPYVIYLDVVINDELVKVVDDVDRATYEYSKWYLMPRPYLPHCTLAFRDLTKEGFEKGLEYLKNVDPSITATVDHIALVDKLPDVDRELVRFNFVEK